MRLWSAVKSAVSRNCGWMTAAAVIASLPGVARAAGINIAENGAESVARGGTTSGLLDTAYALEFNPAGLTTINGLDVRVGGRLIRQDASFSRAQIPMSNINSTVSSANGVPFESVSNGAGWNFLPSIHIGYHPTSGFLSHFAFGAGMFGPPGVVHFAYPDLSAAQATCKAMNPDSTDDQAACADAKTPQRYSLIDANMVVAYPSIGVAYKPIDKVSIGLTLQAVVSAIKFKEALGINLLDHTEDPRSDAVVTLDVSGHSGLTGVAGIVVQPIEGLTLNASYHPRVFISASGKVNVDLPDQYKKLATITGDQGTLSLKLPSQVRVGAAYKKSRFSGAADFVYEGWSWNDNFTVQNNIAISSSVLGPNPQPVGTIAIKNGWQNTYSGRIGGGYDIFRQKEDGFGLQVNAGAMYETNAIPSAEQAVPFITGSRFGLSGGVTVGYKGFGFTAAVMGFPKVSFDVTDSAQARGVAKPETDPANTVYVGNGHYETSTLVLAFGLSYTGLGSAN